MMKFVDRYVTRMCVFIRRPEGANPLEQTSQFRPGQAGCMHEKSLLLTSYLCTEHIGLNPDQPVETVTASNQGGNTTMFQFTPGKPVLELAAQGIVEATANFGWLVGFIKHLPLSVLSLADRKMGDYPG